jgi:hypothetical protein
VNAADILAARVYLVAPKPTESTAHLKKPGDDQPGARCGSSYGFWLSASSSVCKPLPTPEGVPLTAGFVLVHGKRRLELCAKCIADEAAELWPEEFTRSWIPAERLRRVFGKIRERAEVLERETAAPGAPPAFDAGAFVTLCRFDLPDIREQLAALERAWRECLDDLEAVGVLRPGHNPPDGVGEVQLRMHGLRACIHLIDVMIGKLEGKR